MELTRIDIDASSLRASLGDCLAYCGERATRMPDEREFATVLRSEALRDVALRYLPPARRSPKTPGLSFEPEFPFEDAFREFAATRHRLVVERGVTSSLAIDEELARPRSLLVVDWPCSVLDGAPKIASNGLCDFNELPPWDTWLASTNHPTRPSDGPVVVAWIPRWATESMQTAIDAACVGNLTWVLPTDGGFAIQGRL
ncbi:MAG: hypothetical protein HYR85_01620 [Planctomycetes bacterium]|nr:hypothetical protein [Planctomycetota bacterium]